MSTICSEPFHLISADVKVTRLNMLEGLVASCMAKSDVSSFDDVVHVVVRNGLTSLESIRSTV